ncbi:MULTISPECIES: winged helix-turn-helix domain-containing protein [Natrinema]|uniref:Transcriptional regulator n=2 Tax=Natrinema TaxID=88723 RepID=A0A2A5QZK5_9EURY|nr:MULTISPECIES: helix-turn-helix domain-containing protein [Natrinema]MBZ6495374.1 helix-turn-helix domain-containing protein [Natrinema longum]PCR92298.1 transcriptional regulator [Natrinema ejinorense]QSW86653.1 helix-turn-helix transcriptional regulator [Natrinema longum]
MVRDPFASESTTSAEEICAALDDPDCREIIRNLEEPMTAAELSKQCEIPQSTLYRKLELLTEATLLEESTEIRQDGHHASKYSVAFDEITLGLDEDRSLSVQIERPARTADERLAELWSEVRKET